MGPHQKNGVHFSSDMRKDEDVITKNVNKTFFRLLSIPVAQFVVSKFEAFLETIERAFNWPTPHINNNVRDHVYDLKSTSENDIINFQDNDFSPLGWFFLIPIVLCVHLCHFYVNVTLFVVNKPLLEFQDLRWSLQYTKVILNELRKKGAKDHRRRQKLVAQRISQQPPRLNLFCRIFSKWPLLLFVKRVRKALNFLGIITIPLKRDLESITANNQVTIEENHRASDTPKESMLSKPTQARRVSVTVQEIIFEEAEDCLGNENDDDSLLSL